MPNSKLEQDQRAAGRSETTSSTGAGLRRGRHSAPTRAIAVGRRCPAALTYWLILIMAAGAAWLIRMDGINRNYDIFIDEVTYARIADNLATNHGLVLYGQAPFDLHPPAALALYALFIDIFAIHGPISGVLFQLRPVAALLGSIACVATGALVARVTDWKAGLTVAAIAMIDPFEIYYDSHVMLEAPAQLAAVLTIALLTRSLYSETKRTEWLLIVTSGFAAGFTICAKEYFGLVIGLVLVCCTVTGWTVRRSQAGIALAIMGGCYLLSESLVIKSTGSRAWLNQSTSGLRRLIGIEQTTGFNSAAVHVSLLSRLAANASHYGVTYLILGTGALVGLLQLLTVLLRHRQWPQEATPAGRGRLLVVLWTAAAAVYVGYATVFGTLEEQTYYLLFLPALCSLVVAIRRHSWSWAAWRGKVTIPVIALTAVLLADSAVWVGVHQRTDDEYSQLLAWSGRWLPEGSTVSVTEGTAQFLLPGVVLGDWTTVPALISHHVDYVLISTALVDQGYESARPAFARYLRNHAPTVFRATGPSEGALIMYDVRAITGARK